MFKISLRFRPWFNFIFKIEYPWMIRWESRILFVQLSQQVHFDEQQVYHEFVSSSSRCFLKIIPENLFVNRA